MLILCLYFTLFSAVFQLFRILYWHNVNFFLWAQEMNLLSSTRPRCGLVPWVSGVYASLMFLSAECWLQTNRDGNIFPKESRTLAQWREEVKCQRVAERLNSWYKSISRGSNTHQRGTWFRKHTRTCPYTLIGTVFDSNKYLQHV